MVITKNLKIFFVLLITVLLIFYPLSAIVLTLGAIGAYIKRDSLDTPRQIAVIISPLLMGLILAWIFSTTYADIFSTTAPLSVTSWLKVTTLHNPANTAGRIGFIVGSLITIAGIFFTQHQRSRASSMGVVRGRKVIAGGYANFADIADKCDFGFLREGQTGVPLGLMSNKPINVNPNKGKIKMAGHALVIGATGSGKSYSYIRPQIIAAALAGNSIVVTDPKGELFTDTANWLKSKGYEILLFNLADPSKSYHWNMITEAKDMDEIMDLSEWMIMSAGDDEAFWSGGEVNLLAAALGYIKFTEQNNIARNIRSALRLLSFPQERIDELIAALPENTETETVKEVWSGTAKLFQNYVEGVRNKLRIITKGSLADLTSYSDFDLSTIGSRKTALFLILPEEGEYQALLVPFYAFMFRRLNELAFASGGKLPVPTRFIMDEFANIGRVPDIDKVCALGRSKGIMVHIAVQNIGQLQGLYKRNNIWEAVVGNCPIKLCLGVDDINSARYFTDIMGEAEVEDINERKNITTPLDQLQIRRKTMITKETDTMRPYELLQMPESDCIALLRGRKPLYLQKLGWVGYPQAKEIEAAKKTTPAEWDLPAPPEQPTDESNNTPDESTDNTSPTSEEPLEQNNIPGITTL